MFKKIFQFLLFLGIGVGVMYLVFRSQNAAFQAQCRLDGTPAEQCSLLRKLLHDFSTVRPLWVALLVLAFTVSNVFRALRWQMLLAPMGHTARFPNALLTILLGYFANLGFPRMGEVVRAGSLARYERIPLQKVMGTLVVDRLMDVLCLGLVLGLAFLMEGDTLWRFLTGADSGQAATTGLWQSPWVLGLLALVGLALAAGLLLRQKLAQLAFVRKLLAVAAGFWEGLRSVFKLRRPGLFLAYSLGIWLMFYLQCYFNLQAFPPTSGLGLSAALMVFVFGTLGFVIPSPGGMGTYHALCIAGLTLYGISGSDGFSYANISFFTVQIFYNLVGGIAALVILPLINAAKGKPAQ
jgi:hypothetical protein